LVFANVLIAWLFLICYSSNQNYCYMWIEYLVCFVGGKLSNI